MHAILFRTARTRYTHRAPNVSTPCSSSGTVRVLLNLAPFAENLCRKRARRAEVAKLISGTHLCASQVEMKANSKPLLARTDTRQVCLWHICWHSRKHSCAIALELLQHDVDTEGCVNCVKCLLSGTAAKVDASRNLCVVSFTLQLDGCHTSVHRKYEVLYGLKREMKRLIPCPPYRTETSSSQRRSSVFIVFSTRREIQDTVVHMLPSYKNVLEYFFTP